MSDKPGLPGYGSGDLPRPKARMTVTETVYHQVYGDEDPAEPCSRAFARDLYCDEQPLSGRRAAAAAEWAPLCSEWVEKAAMLVLANEEGRGLLVNPDEAARRALAKKVIELGVRSEGGPVVAFGRVRPGETCRLEPADLAGLRVRCAAGPARYALTLIPG